MKRQQVTSLTRKQHGLDKKKRRRAESSSSFIRLDRPPKKSAKSVAVVCWRRPVAPQFWLVKISKTSNSRSNKETSVMESTNMSANSKSKKRPHAETYVCWMLTSFWNDLFPMLHFRPLQPTVSHRWHAAHHDAPLLTID